MFITDNRKDQLGFCIRFMYYKKYKFLKIAIVNSSYFKYMPNFKLLSTLHAEFTYDEFLHLF